MKAITTLLILIALVMSSFTGCSSSSDSDTDADSTIKYLINTLENKDIPSDASLVAQSEGTKVEISRNVESDTMNVYVLKGSVEVIETIE
jgi:uncharacterized protein YcfL